VNARYTSEPRWPAAIALLAAACLWLALPRSLSIGPVWLLLAIVLALLLPIIFSHRRGLYNVNRILSLTANGVITVAMISSLVFLVEGLPKHQETPEALLRSAGLLWIANVLVFALWYWRLDAGGPHGRDRREGRLESSFLFPQMLEQDSLDPEIKRKALAWSPHFVDYLFLAFNTSTAFSPADTAVLSRWAKLGMMTQALISLSIVVLLAARAVGIL
jgi:hypothetical protein